jgi:hypothetical protein
MIACDHFGREPYPFERDLSIVASSVIKHCRSKRLKDRHPGAARGRGLRPRRVPARSRVPANEKTRGQFPGAGFAILLTIMICQ